MNRATYLSLVRAVPIGKRLPGAIYLHRAALSALPADLRAAVREAARIAGIRNADFNVIKLSLTSPKLSILSYPTFFTAGFPLLAASWSVDLGTGKVTPRRYPPNSSAPVLHRKERLLPPGHPAIPRFVALTKSAEDLGLFESTELIGHGDAWNERLRARNVRVEANRLVRVSDGRRRMRHDRAMPTKNCSSNPSYTAKVLAKVMAPIEAWQKKRGKKVPSLTSPAYDRMVGEYWDAHEVVRGKAVAIRERNPSRRMPAEAINRNIYDDLNELSTGGRGDHLKGWPEGHWGDVKIILSWLRGNEMSSIARFFVGSMKKGPVPFAHEFYLDDRIFGSPVHTDWTKGRVGKRDVDAAVKRMHAVAKEATKARAHKRKAKR